MSKKHTIIKGTFILTATGLLTRLMGFFFRMFQSHVFGEAGVGLYQLIFPVYALGFSFTCAGIELALSRCVSRYLALNNPKKARNILYTSLILSLFLSLITTLFLQKYAFFIADKFLQNSDTLELLLLLSYIFPFASIHSCIAGYFLGQKNTRISAISQLVEQIFRILSVFLFYKLSKYCYFDFKLFFSVLGLLIGEIASCFYCIKVITGKYIPLSFPRLNFYDFSSSAKELLTLSFPLTISRVLLNILQSIEAVSIPLSLVQYGLSQNESLSVYGVLTGMALPCILFPSAITNAVSTMLLPAVAEIQALDDYTSLRKIVKKALLSCSLLGTFSCVGFIFFGKLAGNILFDSILAGKFIITLAWMCPFLYTNNTLLSIINGIGKTIISFLINAMNLTIRIFSVFFIIPSFGIYGYLLGLLFSQVFVFISSLLCLYKQLKAEVS